MIYKNVKKHICEIINSIIDSHKIQMYLMVLFTILEGVKAASHEKKKHIRCPFEHFHIIMGYH